MAVKIYISGNFLLAEDSLNKDQFFKVKTPNVYHLRDANDVFAFFNEGTAPKTEGAPQLFQLGIQNNWAWDSPDLVQTHKTNFEFAEILDGNGVPYASADALDLYLNENLGGSGGSGGGLTSVSHDATLSGDGTVGNPLSVVAGGTGLLTKSGIVVKASFSGNPKKFTITFTTPFPSTNYSIVINPNTQNNSAYNVDHESKLATGFDINTHSNNINNLIDVSWIAIQNGETN